MEDIKIESLTTASEYIVKLIAGIDKCIYYIQCGEEYKNGDLMEKIVEGVQWLSEVLFYCRKEVNNDKYIDSLNENFKEIVNAFENEDYILLGDLFNYELIPTLKFIKESIDKSLNNLIS